MAERHPLAFDPRLDSEATEDRLAQVVSEAAQEEDLWLFSGADDIGVVLRAVFGDAQPLP